MLRSRKVPFVKESNTLDQFQWLGSRSRVTGVKAKYANMTADYARDGRWLDFTGRLRSIKPPSGSSFSITAKEQVCNALIDMSAYIDVDIRTKLEGGKVSNPNDWVLIKRVCNCIRERVDTDQETAYQPDDDGETLITIDYASMEIPFEIRRVEFQEYDLYLKYANFLDMNGIPAITVRDKCTLVIGSGDEDTGYGIGYGEYNALEFGLQHLALNFASIGAVDRIVVGVVSNGNVYYSVTGGLMFKRVTSISNALVVSVLAYSNIWIGCEAGVIYRSGDVRTYELVETNDAFSGDIVTIVDTEYGIHAIDRDANLAVYKEGTFQKIIDVPVVDTVTSLIYGSGIFYVAGYDVSGNPTIVASTDCIMWETVFSLDGSNDLGSKFDFRAQCKLAVCSCGVMWASIVYSTGSSMNMVANAALYRSIDYGLNGTWERLWYDTALISNDADVIFLPFDVVCCGSNEAYVVGAYWDRSWNIPYYISEEYAPGLLVFRESCSEC